MQLTNQTNGNYTTRQLKLPLEIEKLIDIADPVYTFCEVMDHIDLSKYFVEKGYKKGRPRCDEQKLLKVILFAFMEHGISSLREIEKLCRTDIRYMYLLDDLKAPSFATFGNLIRNELTTSIEQIFKDINDYIFEKDHVDLEHAYIDGTKIEANANRYTWVWKKSCVRNRDKVFEKISLLIDAMNEQVLGYANRIEICGNSRNSYSKTDHDATFMRIKSDYMGNDQLLPAYNMQAVICDEYIAVIDAKPYASDMECFVPLMDKFNSIYGHYPRYPVADAGYGSYNNYLYCEEHGMEKFMKFTMFEKETKDAKYHNNPYRADNFRRDEKGNLLCPNNKKIVFKYNKPVYKNKYGRTEEIYECEDCTGCPYRQECMKKTEGNRTVRLNQELTSFHQEVIDNY